MTARRWFAAAMAFTVGAAIAQAQQAPAGNAHPETVLVSDAKSALANPFGEPTGTHAVPVSPGPGRPALPPDEESLAKHAFAKSLDLDPLRGLNVFHDGRVKILDTLARETVRTITGRKAYFDVVRADSGHGYQRLAYDPLFTLLDLVIDPGYYHDRPLVHIEYLPLRRAFVEVAVPMDAREFWLKQTRLTPAMISRYGEQIADRYTARPPYRKGLMELDRALSLQRFSGSNMLLVAPESPDEPYRHLATLPPDHPASIAAAALGRAWRAQDAPGANAAIRDLAAALPSVNPEVYSPKTGLLALGISKGRWELAYNRINAFEWGYWFYFLALLTLMLGFATGRRWLVVSGASTLALAIGLHAFGFYARCVIAERFAIQNQYESMTGLSLFAVLAGAIIMLARRQWLFGAASAGVGFLVLITATQTNIPGGSIEREAAILNTSVLLKYHVTTVLVAYGLISLGFIIALFYLGTYYGARLKGLALGRGFAAPDPGPPGSVAAVSLGSSSNGSTPTLPRVLSDLDKAHMTVLQLAFWTLAVGIMLGAWWADHSWGRWWGFDPKETWALATWIIYLIVIHVRMASPKNKALVTAWLSVAGFFMMLWTYFGVNLLLPGLHAYA